MAKNVSKDELVTVNDTNEAVDQAGDEDDNTGNKKHRNIVVNEGFGRFEYQNGTIYEGQWKNFDGKKMKHGEGHLIHTANSLNEIMREEYKGSWEKDLMSGWGVYKYISGATYAGEWLDNNHHGKGTYEFPDGCIYEGEWKCHKMNGEGTFTDKNGTKWSGLFVDGVFQSKMQKRLKMEKVVTQKKTRT